MILDPIQSHFLSVPICVHLWLQLLFKICASSRDLDAKPARTRNPFQTSTIKLLAAHLGLQQMLVGFLFIALEDKLEFVQIVRPTKTVEKLRACRQIAFCKARLTSSKCPGGDA